ncbi:hypothetical protein [Neobacillus drentensis]
MEDMKMDNSLKKIGLKAKKIDWCQHQSKLWEVLRNEFFEPFPY